MKLSLVHPESGCRRRRKALQAVEIKPILPVAISDMLAEAHGCRIRESRQAIETKVSLECAETCRCRIREGRNATERKSALMFSETRRRDIRNAHQAVETKVPFQRTEALQDRIGGRSN